MREAHVSIVIEEPVVDQQIWRAWVQRGRQREQVTGRKTIVLAGIVFAAASVGSVFYLLASR